MRRSFFMAHCDRSKPVEKLTPDLHPVVEANKWDQIWKRKRRVEQDGGFINGITQRPY